MRFTSREATRLTMGRMARSTALAFDQRKWNAQWAAIIDSQRAALARL